MSGLFCLMKVFKTKKSYAVNEQGRSVLWRLIRVFTVCQSPKKMPLDRSTGHIHLKVKGYKVCFICCKFKKSSCTLANSVNPRSAAFESALLRWVCLDWSFTFGLFLRRTPTVDICFLVSLWENNYTILDTTNGDKQHGTLSLNVRLLPALELDYICLPNPISKPPKNISRTPSVASHRNA